MGAFGSKLPQKGRRQCGRRSMQAKSMLVTSLKKNKPDVILLDLGDCPSRERGVWQDRIYPLNTRYVRIIVLNSNTTA